MLYGMLAGLVLGLITTGKCDMTYLGCGLALGVAVGSGISKKNNKDKK